MSKGTFLVAYSISNNSFSVLPWGEQRKLIHLLFIWVSEFKGLLLFLYLPLAINIFVFVFDLQYFVTNDNNQEDRIVETWFGNFSSSEELNVDWVRRSVSCGQELCLTTRGILSCEAPCVGFLENHLTLNKNPKSTQIWPKYLYCLTLMETWLGIPPSYLLSVMWSMTGMAEGSQIATIVKDREVGICSLWLSLTKINDLCPHSY